MQTDMAEAAKRLVTWAGSEDVKSVGLRLARLRTPGGLPPDSEPLLSDAAAWIGETLRAAHGGHWHEHPLWGLVLQDLGGVPGLRLIPLAVAEKQVELGARFDLLRFFEAVPRRIDGEVRVASAAPTSYNWESLRTSTDTGAVALGLAEAFRAEWKTRLSAELPFTLIGVREMDGWLRSHYLLNRIEEPTLVTAGFFVGEVARGLFGGEWHFADAAEPHEAALRFPELDYFPVGRLYKLALERPEAQPLDEYIRLVPSARKELRSPTAPSKDTT